MQCQIDLLLHNDGTYTVVLLPAPKNGIGGGACPQIPSIRPEVFHTRLMTVLGITQKVLDKVVERIETDPDHETEIPVNATMEQLQQLGFTDVPESFAA